ncbi:MAG: VOC family protein [Cyclobacteriaceae bacterium]|nr:VOC family protein [Cyclobacteriaceae bacterium]
MKNKIDYDNYILPANNLNKAKKFYRDLLGLPIKFDFSEKGMVAFKVGNNEPAIILREGKNVQPTIILKVEDVKTSFQELKELGVQFLSQPFKITTGLFVEFLDPFGNKLAITDYSK